MRLLNRGLILSTGIIFWLLVPGPLNPYMKAFFNNKPPQLILVLGGDIDRERVGAGMAKLLRLPLLVSGGSNPEHAQWLINKAGVAPEKAKLDYRAKDTLTNFTSLVDDLASEGITHTILVTSKDHLPRAIAVGNVIAGSRGIRLTSIPVACAPNCQKESFRKQFVDIVRALTWLVTGKDPKKWAKINLSKNIKTNFEDINYFTDKIIYQAKS